MKKIGIVTLYGLSNYGNRLQNYASQRFFESLGYDTYSIINDDFEKLKKKETLNIVLKRKIKYIIDKDLRVAYRKHDEKKLLFIDFENKIKKYHVNNEMLPTLKNMFDYFAVGSDQVWNPWCMESFDWYFLNFCNNSQKICLSPSIGLNELPDEYNIIFKNKLKDFSLLSCREYEGSQVLKRLTGKEIETIIDPTMMLTVKEWDKVIKKPTFHKDKKYVILYFLGELASESSELFNELNKQGYKIINILDINSNYYVCGPSEFVWLIKNASLIITDSFHGCVFSILYKTPFISFNRKGSLQMNSRLNTLLKKFNFKERMYSTNLNYNEVLNQDFSNVDKILEFERKKFIGFIKKCLN